MIRALEEHRKKIHDLATKLSALIWRITKVVCMSRADIFLLEDGITINCLYNIITYKGVEYEENDLLPLDIIVSILQPKNFEFLLSLIYNKSILKQLKEELLRDAEIIDRLL